LRLLCKDPAALLARRYEATGGVVGVSATLEPIAFYRDILGLPGERTDLVTFPSPFPPEHRRVVICPRPSTRFRHRERDAGLIAATIRDAAAVHPANYLVCFPSFDFLEAVAPLVEGLPGFEVLRQGRRMSEEERASVLERLRQTGPAPSGTPPVLLLAVNGGIFTEGVDYPGSMCEGAMIIGPGLPRFDLERELLREHFEARFGKGFEYAYLYPGMSRVIQAAGRVIRTPEDRGVILLVCRRFAESAYASLLPRDWFDLSPQELVAADPCAPLREFWGALAGTATEGP
jgi:DNA excision repair protein ERCC-2